MPKVKKSIIGVLLIIGLGNSLFAASELDKINERIQTLKSQLESYQIKTGSIKTLDPISVDKTGSIEDRIDHEAASGKMVVLFHDEAGQNQIKTIGSSDEAISKKSEEGYPSKFKKNPLILKPQFSASEPLEETLKKFREMVENRKKARPEKMEIQKH
ncbi:MAG: hypothetical protein HQM08_21335 [Candidatus Riflebacteria bacterium]|nr:hypothetical protein [Candidatus Riflebacteria bacterium]